MFRNLLIADLMSDIGTFMQGVGAAWLMVSQGAEFSAYLQKSIGAAVDCHSPGLSPTTLVLHIDGQRPLTPMHTVKWS
jgi:hypothetical protein